ncbi:MAG: hypothetical protein ACQERR_08455 [Pseudomonadota bacterium]
MTDTHFLDQPRPLPTGHGEDNIVQWHVFRSRAGAEAFAPHIMLEGDQQLVGGQTEDSIGTLWWLGVHVDNLADWGNHDAVHKHDVRT